jgi:hypothetical protein
MRVQQVRPVHLDPRVCRGPPFDSSLVPVSSGERVDLNLGLGGLVVARWRGCRGRSASVGKLRLD